MISILHSFGHHDFVVNFTERPIVGTAGATQADLDAWDVENNRTHPFLILNCHDSVLSHLRAVDTAPKVWIVLTTLYEMKTPGRIITLETQLLQLRVEDFLSVSAFVAKMKEMREELAVCGKTISSEDMAVRLLAKLPSQFDSLFSSIVSAARATPITWEELLPMVMQVEGRLSSRTSSKGADTALASQKGKNKNQGKKKNQGRRRRTLHRLPRMRLALTARKQDILRVSVTKRKEDEEKKKKESASSSAVVASSAKEGMYVSVEGHSAYVTSESRTWLLDSGATSHMTNRRDWFSSFSDSTGEITICHMHNCS